jgi:drug/metabolite transporter (DMT)-like permease
MTNSLNLLLLLAMTVAGSLGSLCFRLFSFRRRLVILLLGFGLYGAGALLNIYLLKVLPYTVVLPANAITFIWVILLSRAIFKEHIGLFKWMGTAFIIVGLLLLIVP